MVVQPKKRRLDDPVEKAEVESRWEAAPAVLFVILLQIELAVTSAEKGWKLWSMPWWVWLVPVGPELALLLPLAFSRPRRRLEQLGHRRNVAIGLLCIISIANTIELVTLVGSLVSGQEKNGPELLLKGVTIWATNMTVFGLWFWAIDRGGPVRRRAPDAPLPDFQFPQMENPQLAPDGWRPQLLDYVYTSFTNSIAFSPTDAMPLTAPAKLLMLAESAVSAITVLLVAARSVNIFS